MIVVNIQTKIKLDVLNSLETQNKNTYSVSLTIMLLIFIWNW